MEPATLACTARLLRWLGPWAPESRVPAGVSRRTIHIGGAAGGELEARVYVPRHRPPVGSLLLVPGLHYLGPADPRMDRFASILGAAGIVVLAPFLPDFCALRVSPRLIPDTRRALDALLELDERPRDRRPGMFSISFGSLPALRVAASEDRAGSIGGLVVFGGYADWGETLRFALHGDGDLPHDPLNRPVVFMNLVDHLEGVPADPEPLLAAWARYVRSTWGRPEMKARERWEPAAREVAATLDDDARELFLVGCGLAPGGWDLCRRALERGGDAHAWLDPRPHLAGLRCPIHLVHGRDDDVIPHTQLEALAEAIPTGVPLHRWLTGMYAHTGQTGVARLAAMAPALAGEIRSMAGILEAITSTATDAHRRS